MKNKNAQIRYEALNKCLSSREGYSIDGLVEACNRSYRDTPGMEGVTISSRQVLKDLEDLKKIYGVEILKREDPEDRRRKLFSYPDGAKDIHGDRLLDADYGDFNQAIWLLESLVGLPYVKKAADTLKKKIKPDEGGEAPVFSVETNPGLTNFDQIGSYFNDIRQKEPVEITYNASFEKEKKFWFQPYFLKQYNMRWFLFGWNYEYEPSDSGPKGRLECLAIDRIMKKRYGKSSFSMYHAYRPNDIDFSHYFDDIIGVTHPKGGKVEKIMLKIHDTEPRDDGRPGYGMMDWHRILTKPLHRTQEICDEMAFTLTIDVMPNNELYSTLSQYEHLEVVSPAEVRNAYLKRVANIIASHRKPEENPE